MITTPDEPTPDELTLAAPSTTDATFTVSAPRQVCGVGEDPQIRFVQIGNLQTYDAAEDQVGSLSRSRRYAV